MGPLTCLKIAKERSWDKFHFTAKPVVGMCFLQRLNVSLQLFSYVKVEDPNENKGQDTLYVYKGGQGNLGMVLYPLGDFIHSSLSFSLIYGQFLLLLLFLALLNDCFARNKAMTQACQMGPTLQALRGGLKRVYETRHVWGELEISLEFHKKQSP